MSQMMTTFKSYSELITLDTFEDRFNYLKLDGIVGSDTFGFDRVLNQDFYRSREWKQVRSFVIVRDNGCDLGIFDQQIMGNIYVHHINPITKEDFLRMSPNLLDPDNLISVSMDTHNALHFGDNSIINRNKIIDRKPNDTIPWKRVDG